MQPARVTPNIYIVSIVRTGRRVQEVFGGYKDWIPEMRETNGQHVDRQGGGGWKYSSRWATLSRTVSLPLRRFRPCSLSLSLSPVFCSGTLRLLRPKIMTSIRSHVDVEWKAFPGIPWNDSCANFRFSRH